MVALNERDRVDELDELEVMEVLEVLMLVSVFVLVSCRLVS